MTSIELIPEHMQRTLHKIPENTPIVMINLLRYREQADYADDAGAAPCSGHEAYQRYIQAVGPLITKVGGSLLWAGAVASTVIAPEGEEWDDALLVEYPARQAFLDMTSSAAYQAILFHRTAALADSRLIATTTSLDPRQGRD